LVAKTLKRERQCHSLVALCEFNHQPIQPIPFKKRKKEKRGLFFAFFHQHESCGCNNDDCDDNDMAARTSLDSSARCGCLSNFGFRGLRCLGAAVEGCTVGAQLLWSSSRRSGVAVFAGSVEAGAVVVVGEGRVRNR
jgi:hypothetical protein